MSQTTIEYNDDPIAQNHERGPGWFLKIAYVVIAISCVLYLYFNWSWKSSYEEQQAKIKTELSK